MRTFSYRARTADGRQVRGDICAESGPAAARALAAEGRVVVHLTERRALHLPRLPQIFGGLTEEERIAFFHETASLMGAGMPIHEALARLAEASSPASAYGRVAAALHRAVLHGAALSQAMEMHPRAFAPSIVGMVRAGEESGSLAAILREAAAFLTEASAVRASLITALAYPFFLLAASIVSLAVMTVFVLPVFAALLRDLRTDLPLPTRILLTLFDTAAAHPYALLTALILLSAAGAALLSLPAVRLRLDGIVLRVPVIGAFLRFTGWQMILRTLAILLHSGIRLDRAVHLTRTVTDNRVLAQRLARAEQGLVEGRTFTQMMVQEPYLPHLLRGMLAAGDAAGDLEVLLRQAADYCQRRAGQIGARMERLAEPVMIVLIAAVIFFAVLSFLLPIFDAMDALM